jgi:type I restriction enzyme, S subunit
MSSKPKTTATKEAATPAWLPELRFPEFREAGGWRFIPLNCLAIRTKQKNRDEIIDRVLTNSAEFGVVDQRDFFDKDIATQGKLEGYCVVELGSYVYNPRISSTAPVGPISKNKIGTGVMSPLYTVFKFKDDRNDFYEHFFKTTGWHTYMRQASSTGARHDRMAISNDDFMAMPLPVSTPEEQQKIAECLSSVDELIAAQARKVDALKTHKKGLMQQLFPREGETQPRLRFPEFQNAGEWVKGSLDGVLSAISNGLSLTQSADNAGYKVTRIETISAGAIDLEKIGFVKPTQDVSAYKLQAGDILFSNINSISHIGKSVFYDRDYDLYHGMNLLRLVVDRSKGEPKFVFYLINTSGIRASLRERANKAVNQANINQTELGKTELALPSLPEQQRIATCLSSHDALITAETQKLEALKTHKKGLMQQLFPSPEEVEA